MIFFHFEGSSPLSGLMKFLSDLGSLLLHFLAISSMLFDFRYLLEMAAVSAFAVLFEEDVDTDWSGEFHRME